MRRSAPPVDVPCWVELSGENLALADRELAACLAVLDPSVPPATPVPWGERWREVRLPSAGLERPLASRLAYAHRVARPLGEGTVDLLAETLVLQGGSGASARVRVASGAPSELQQTLPPLLGHAFVQGGGRIDLEQPDRDLLAIIRGPVSKEGPGATEGALVEVVAEVPRSEVESRRARHRPFRKPVTLPPRLARAVVNLARVPIGGTLLDPFCGTGALLLEAASLGYRTCGSDLDAEMVRGCLRNMEALGLPPQRLVQSAVSEVAERLDGLVPVDGVVGDPPYGRSASTGGSEPVEVLRQALEAVPRLLRSGGRAALVIEDPTPVREMLPSQLVQEDLVEAQRVHRSLTRWVVVLRRV